MTIARDTFTIGSSTPQTQVPNQLGLPWLTIWNTGSGSIAVGAPYQVVGALRRRSFYVEQDDPITLYFYWGQRNTQIATQPGQKDRVISYALSDEPLAGLEEEPIYATPNLLVAGTLLGNTAQTITPNAGEVYTHLDLAWANAQGDGDQFEVAQAAYGKGLNETLLFPPKGTSRQIIELYGPTFVALSSTTLTARCDWQIFGVANVVR